VKTEVGYHRGDEREGGKGRRENSQQAAHLNSIKASFWVVQAAEKQLKRKHKPKNKLFKKNMFYINFFREMGDGRRSQVEKKQKQQQKQQHGKH